MHPLEAAVTTYLKEIRDQRKLTNTTNELSYRDYLGKLLREAAKDYITDEVYRGLKQPFLAPPTTKRNDDAMFVMLQDILRSESFASVPFFDRTAVTIMLDDIATMDDEKRASMDPILYMMASIGVLHEKYKL